MTLFIAENIDISKKKKKNQNFKLKNNANYQKLCTTRVVVPDAGVPKLFNQAHKLLFSKSFKIQF